MTILNIVHKNLQKRLLSTLLTILGVAIGVGLVFTVLVVDQKTRESFDQTSTGFDLILAAKGSALQATLNTIYHLETSTGLVPYALYETAAKDPRVEYAFPFYVGDQHQGFRVVGTSIDYLEKASPRKNLNYTFSKGNNFEGFGTCVLGSSVAERLGLGLGDEIQFVHGLSEGNSGFELKAHDEHYVTVSGILNPTYTANDQVIFTDIKSLEAIHQNKDFSADDEDDHTEHDEHDHAHEDDIEVEHLDAVLVKMKNPAAALQLSGLINYPTPANPLIAMNMRKDPFFKFKEEIMAVIPSIQIDNLLGVVGRIQNILSILTWFVVLVALIGIFVGLYNSMESRRRDISIMRSLGATKMKIFLIVVLEATAISTTGALLGWILSQFGLIIFSPMVAEMTGVIISGIAYSKEMIFYFVLFVLTGALIGSIPAVKAYRTNVLTYLNKDA